MSTSAVSSTSSSKSSASQTSGTSAVGNNLTQADFLSLLTTQLQNQDPLKPMDDAQFIAQLASFTSLQQTTDISTTLSSLSSSLQQMGAVNYLNKTVSLTDPNGKTVTGSVTGVNIKKGTPYVTVNGTDYTASSITSVTPSTTASTSNN